MILHIDTLQRDAISILSTADVVIDDHYRKHRVSIDTVQYRCSA